MRALISTCILFLTLGNISAQSNLLIEGSVYGTKGLPLKNVEIIVLDDQGVKIQSLTTTPNGRFKFEFEFGASFDIVFRKPEHIAKQVKVNTTGVPEDAWGWGYEFGNIRVELESGSEKTEPELAAEIYYSPEDENFTYAR